MSVRVNLLRAEELRYQGAVSREFILRAVMGTAVAILVLSLLSSVMHRRSQRHELALSRERWQEIEPRYARVRQMQQQLAGLVSLQNELQGWNTSRIEWNALLTDLQKSVPPTVQLTKLNVKGELGILETQGANGEMANTPARKFTLRLDGRTSDDAADTIVVAFANGLRETPTFQEALESVKLQGLQRSTSGGRESERMFGIEGISMMRLMP